MSICYCETHDQYFDSDYHLNCPVCQVLMMVYCYYCSQGSDITEEMLDQLEQGMNIPCPACGEPRWADIFE